MSREPNERSHTLRIRSSSLGLPCTTPIPTRQVNNHITSKTPASHESDVAIDTTITFTFDESIRAVSVWLVRDGRLSHGPLRNGPYFTMAVGRMNHPSDP